MQLQLGVAGDLGAFVPQHVDQAQAQDFVLVIMVLPAILVVQEKL